MVAVSAIDTDPRRELRYELDILDDFRERVPTVRELGTERRISKTVEGLNESRVFLEVAGIVGVRPGRSPGGARTRAVVLLPEDDTDGDTHNDKDSQSQKRANNDPF